jgi:hypothetical protein
MITFYVKQLPSNETRMDFSTKKLLWSLTKLTREGGLRPGQSMWDFGGQSGTGTGFS